MFADYSDATDDILGFVSKVADKAATVYTAQQATKQAQEVSKRAAAEASAAASRAAEITESRQTGTGTILPQLNTGLSTMTWIGIGAGSLLVIGLIIYFTTRKPAIV